MKARLNGKGVIEIDVTELSDSMSDDERDRFAQSIVFQESLLSAVVGQLVTGQSFDGWYIGDMADRLREQLLPIVPTAMRELVASLLEQRDRAKEQLSKTRDALYRIERHWPQSVTPNLCNSTRPEYCSCVWKQADVEAFLARELGPNWEDQCRSSATEGATT